MIEFTLRQLWSAANNAYKVTIGAESIGFMTMVVGVHIILAVATLGLGDRTVCDILKPLRKIFKPDVESLLEGTLEVAIAIPRAIVYYVSLYLRSYVLAVRVILWMWLSAVLAMLTPLVLAIAMGIVHGFSTPLQQIGLAEQIVPLSFFPSLAYWYWRFDGRRLLINLRDAWNC
jgi:hypothetical protein